MNDKRRPPSLHRGPAPMQESPDPNVITFALIMSNREVVTMTVDRETRDVVGQRISDAIATGGPLTLHGADGQQTIVNTAHVILVNVR